MPDKTITCLECGQPFQFLERDQEFYAKNNFTEPKRCKPCRTMRKKEKEARKEGR